jgi:hypothetical protein
VISLPASTSSPGAKGSGGKAPGAKGSGAKAPGAKAPGAKAPGKAAQSGNADPVKAGSTPPDPRSLAADLTVRIVGTVVAVCLAALTALWEALLTPLHATIFGSVVRLPIAPVVAVIVNVGIFWFGRVVTGRTGLALLPAIAWFVVMFAAGNRTSEGDLLIAGNNWVGIVTILVGAVAWALGAYVVMFRGVRPHEPIVRR